MAGRWREHLGRFFSWRDVKCIRGGGGHIYLEVWGRRQLTIYMEGRRNNRLLCSCYHILVDRGVAYGGGSAGLRRGSSLTNMEGC